VRILFVHAAFSSITPEYQVNLTLTKNFNKTQVDSYFFWQIASGLRDNLPKDHPGTFHYFDFGRDSSVVPRPSRLDRAKNLLKKFPRAMQKALTEARKIQPDIIYTSQQKYDVLIGRCLAKTLRIPHIIHLHYTVGPWLGRHVVKAIHSAPILIAVSEFVRETAILNGIEPSKIHTVPNTIPLDNFRSPPNTNDIRKEFHWPEDSALVASIGRLDPMKGHLLLFEAFAQVVKKVPKARLIVCGSSTTGSGYENFLRKRAADLNLEPYIAFAGYRKDIPQILNNADVFCLPTELEPFGLVFLEAMAARLPVVACISGGTPELVIHGHTGLLSYPNDVNTLAENISKLLLDREMAKRLGQAGQMRLLEEFDSKNISSKWLHILSQTCKKPQ